MTELDVGIIPVVMLTVINGYWTWQGRKVQNDREIIRALQLQLTEKDEVIKDLIKRKNELKLQYGHLQDINKKLEGEIQTYKRFHKHESL